MKENKPGCKGRFIIWLVRHRHFFSLRIKPARFDPSSEAIHRLREKIEKGARMFGSLPAGLEVVPVDISGLYAEWLILPGSESRKAILYFHGGMYVLGSAPSHRQHVVKFVRESGLKALVIDYRLAPEHPFPAALEDALNAYEYLLEQEYRPSDIVFAGDSAGGGLCLATLLALKGNGRPLPAAAAVLSPWTDLKLTGKSYIANARSCISTPGSAEACSLLYSGRQDPGNPLISPLYGDLKGLPPIYISVGSKEILLDDAIKFAGKAAKEGVEVVLRIGEGMCHCYPAFGGLFKEAKAALTEIGKFLRFWAFQEMH